MKIKNVFIVEMNADIVFIIKKIKKLNVYLVILVYHYIMVNVWNL